MPSLAEEIRLLREQLEGPNRFRDVAFMLRREKTKETLLWAGGRWDRIERRFLDDVEVEIAAVVDLEESQTGFTEWFAEFLADFRDGFPRDISAALVAGDRRAGKTFDAYYCQIAALIDVPFIPSTGQPALGWTVSKTFRERDELDELIAARIPHDWFRYQRAPEHRYEFLPFRGSSLHGPSLLNLSADDPDSLKRGKVDWLLYNEVQKMQARAVVNGLYGTADQSGLCVMTANKPSASDTRGEWMFDLREAIDDEAKTAAAALKREPLGIRFFLMSSKNNTKIDAPARKRVGRLAAIIDPTQAEADNDDGSEWKRPGDKACWEFDKHKHLHALPADGFRRVEVTLQVAQRHHYLADCGAIVGGDFQFKPHIIGAFARLFGDPDRPEYHFVDEHVEPRATEEQFIEGINERLPAYKRESTLWVLDASAFWQGAQHDFEANERLSSEVLLGDGWACVPPQPAKGKTGRARNPPVDERLSLFNEMFRQGRLKIDPKRCPWLAECAREATTKRETGRRHLVANKWAHGIDAMSYVVWLCEPKPDGIKMKPSDIVLVGIDRQGWTRG